MLNGADLFSSCAAWLAVFVLGGAALHKLDDPLRFSGAVDEYQLLPAAFAKPSVWLLISAEISAAALLLFGLFAHGPLAGITGLKFFPASTVFAVGAGLSAGLFTLYAFAMGVNLLRGRRDIDCGCGGPAKPLSSLLVARNIALAAALYPCAAGLTAPVSPLPAIAVTGLLGLLAFALYLAIDQAIHNHLIMRREGRPYIFPGATTASSEVQS